jgi:hypothetical protein
MARVKSLFERALDQPADTRATHFSMRRGKAPAWWPKSVKLLSGDAPPGVS